MSYAENGRRRGCNIDYHVRSSMGNYYYVALPTVKKQLEVRLTAAYGGNASMPNQRVASPPALNATRPHSTTRPSKHAQESTVSTPSGTLQNG